VRGDTIFDGDVVYTNTFWDDLRFPALAQNLDTTAGFIDFNYSEGTVTFQSNCTTGNVAHALHALGQMPHSYKHGTDIRPHVHYQQTDANQTNNWYLQYRLQTNDAPANVASWTQIGPAVNLFTYTSGTLNQMAKFPDINGSGLVGSAMIQLRLVRDGVGDTFGGDLEVYELDIHYEIDKPGSPEPDPTA